MEIFIMIRLRQKAWPRSPDCIFIRLNISSSSGPAIHIRLSPDHGQDLVHDQEEYDAGHDDGPDGRGHHIYQDDGQNIFRGL